MNVKIEEKQGFTVVGLKITTTSLDGKNLVEIPKMWDDLTPDDYQRLIKLSDIFPKAVLGICADENRETASFDYWIAAATTQEKPADLLTLEVPTTTYAVFGVTGAMPAAVQNMWRYIFEEWLPSADYQLAAGPEIEYNPDGDPFAADYYSEIWLPVEKKA